MAARQMRAACVPSIAQYITKRLEYLLRRPGQSGPGLAEIVHLLQYMDEMNMGHIGMSRVADALGRGGKLRKTEDKTASEIGENLNHQGRIQYLMDADPDYGHWLKKIYLDDPNRTYDYKIKALTHAMNKRDDLNGWVDFSHQQCRAAGSFVLQAVVSLKDQTDQHYIFERRLAWDNAVKSKRKHKVYYIALTKFGMRWRETIQKMVEDDAGVQWPMLWLPNDWGNDTRGGYYGPAPKKYSQVVHSIYSKPEHITQLGTTHLEALNHLQKVPHRMNQYIYNLMYQLKDRYWKIGSFVTYEYESCAEECMSIKDNDYIESLDKKGDEYKQLMAIYRDEYDKMDLDKKRGMSTQRVLATAERFADEPYFFITWFSDWRGRLNAACDTVNPQGSEWQKALFHSAHGVEINERTLPNLLINLAITGEFETPNGKSNKLTYPEREQWGRDFMESGELAAMVDDPLTYRYWMEAEEPFQFLATCEEIKALFIDKTRDKTRLYVARDMTCSGIQIMSALSRDKAAGEATNVVPMPDGQLRDGYETVAENARELASDKAFLDACMQRREENRIARNKKVPADQHWPERNFVDIDVDRIDRKVCKKATMVAGYGGTFISRSEGVYEACEEAGWELHIADRSIAAKAVIKAMDIAFPKIAEMNEWLCKLIDMKVKQNADEGEYVLSWVTPQGGTEVRQVYRESLMKQIRTWAASGGHYGRIVQDSKGTASVIYGWGDTLPKKHRTAGPANIVHSLDADILVGAIANLPKDWPIYFVHDCAMATASHIDDVVAELRQSFHRTCSYDFLGSLVKRWGLEGVEMLELGDLDLDQCVDSQFMFT